jgi:pimeloyl-ACP methyl ester carboxylesterase
MGGSYGGYLTMMGVTKAPDVWAAGVPIVPFVNWFTEIQNEDPVLQQSDLATMGDIVKEQSALRRPLADQLRRPDQSAAAIYWPEERSALSEIRSAAGGRRRQKARRYSRIQDLRKRRPRLRPRRKSDRRLQTRRRLPAGPRRPSRLQLLADGVATPLVNSTVATVRRPLMCAGSWTYGCMAG